MENKMFCFQCQETAGCTGCTKFGVCGKSPDLARMQDLLIYTTKGVALYSSILRKEGKVSQEINRYLINSLFITITNANFDDNAIIEEIRKGIKIRKELELLLNEENKKEKLIVSLIKFIKNPDMKLKGLFLPIEFFHQYSFPLQQRRSHIEVIMQYFYQQFFLLQNNVFLFHHMFLV